MPRLIFQSEAYSAEPFELVAEKIRVGRQADNELKIDEKSISSHHAELLLDGLDYRLIDLESVNGVRVNGERVKEMKLRRNDQIRFGNVEAVYESEHAPDVMPLPEPTVPVHPGQSAGRGRPLHFKNLSSIAKPSQKDKVPWTLIIIAAFLMAAGGVAFLIMKLMEAQ